MVLVIKKGINIKIKSGIKRERKKNPIRTGCLALSKFYSVKSTMRTELINTETHIKSLCFMVLFMVLCGMVKLKAGQQWKNSREKENIKYKSSSI